MSGKSNLEIDQNQDLVIGNAASSNGVDETTKDVLAAVAQSAQGLSETSAEIEATTEDSEDLSVPKWPKYSDPAAQKEEISKELVEVSK